MIRHEPDWRARAACANVEDPDLFFADGLRVNTRRRREGTEQAQAVCAGCPVQVQCLDLALALPSGFDLSGIFGGLTVEDRNDLRRDDATVAYASNWNEYAWLLGGDRTTRAKRPGGRHAKRDRTSRPTSRLTAGSRDTPMTHETP